MVVNVVGLGYIGLPTALSMAAGGVKVIGTDLKEEIIESLNNKRMTFSEKGMDELLDNAVRSGNISFSTQCQAADIYIIAVPTPYIKISKRIDSKYVENAVKDVISVCPKGSIIAIESTVSPGTIDNYVRPAILAAGKTIGIDVNIAHVPERIIPGNMLYELRHNSRTIGVDDPEIGERLKEIYRSFCKGDMVITDIKSAELTKVIENTYRDINIAFANELAKICRRNGTDVYEIIRIANMHPRVNMLNPGPGVGGHCISVDPWFLVGDYPDIVNIIRHARMINDGQPEYVLKRISEIMDENNIDSISDVGLYGLTYKENVDDTRESPTLQLMDCMRKYASRGVKVYDPYVKGHIVDNQYDSFEDFLNDTRMIVIMVGHDHIKENIEKLRDKVVFDTRNCVREIGPYLL